MSEGRASAEEVIGSGNPGALAVADGPPGDAGADAAFDAHAGEGAMHDRRFDQGPLSVVAGLAERDPANALAGLATGLGIIGGGEGQAIAAPVASRRPAGALAVQPQGRREVVGGVEAVVLLRHGGDDSAVVTVVSASMWTGGG